jgi:hypothetical protein
VSGQISISHQSSRCLHPETSSRMFINLESFKREAPHDIHKNSLQVVNVESPEICSRPKSRPHAQPQNAYRRRRTRNIHGQSSTCIASLQDLILQFSSLFARANIILHNPGGPPPETSQKSQNSAAEEPAHRNRASDQAFRGDLGIGR